jgi:hypothetical protein
VKIPEPLIAGPLRCVWFARGDRLGHRIELVTTANEVERCTPLLESIDESAGVVGDDAWPPSPPLTDWQLEEHPAERVLMAVGRAGHSHWSVVVSVNNTAAGSTVANAPSTGERQFTPGGGPPHSLLMPGLGSPAPRSFAAPRIAFDVACRMREAPEQLGNQYRCLTACRVIDDARLELSPGVTLTVDPATTSLSLDAAAGALKIAPYSSASGTMPQTVRWWYQILIQAEEL